MKTELTIDEDYKETFYVLCRKPLGINEWLFHHKYTDLEKAKSGLKDIMNRNTRYEYKIKEIVITAKDIL